MDQRSFRIKTNIYGIIIAKGFAFISNLLLVPTILGYIMPEGYGVWITISSVIAWITYLDIGLGNGLRNKLGEAFSKKDITLGKEYVSTSYFLLSGIVLIGLMIFICCYPYINWVQVFNSPIELKQEVDKLVLFAVIGFGVLLVLKLIGSILMADQRPAVSETLNATSSVITLISIWVVSQTTEKSLFLLGIVTYTVPIAIYSIASLILFGNKYRNIIPKVTCIHFRYQKQLVMIGVQFFLLQMCGAIVLSSSNIVIIHILGANEVAKYDIVSKYYGFLTTIFLIILTPLWSAYTDAFYKHDIDWIKRVIRKLIIFWICISMVGIVMAFTSKWSFHFWIGDKVEIPLSLTLAMGAYFIVSTWNNIFAYFLNGIGSIRLELYTSVIMAIVVIPLMILYSSYFGLGVTGIPIAISCSLLMGSILTPIQYFKIVNNKAKGIWIK